MSLIAAPLSIKHISIDMIEDTSTMRLIVLPFTFVACAVWPSLLAKTMSEAPEPLATVYRSILESVFTLFALLLIFVAVILFFFITAQVVLHVMHR